MGDTLSIGEVVHQVEAEPSSSCWTPSSHLSEGRSLKETEISGDERPSQRETERPRRSARGQARPGEKLTWSPEHRGRVGAGGGEAAAGRTQERAPPQPFSSSLRARDSTVHSVGGAALCCCPPAPAPFFSRSRPAASPTHPPRANHRSSSRVPAPPLRSSLSHWLEPQGRVPRAGGNHWWAEPAEFPDEGTFCSIKGARKAGDGAV